MAELLYATCILIGGRGVMLRGPSRSGKSDLAYRLMTGPLAARLIADDQTLVTVEGDRLLVHAPETLKGLIELRGLGLLQVPFETRAVLHLVVNLVPRDDVPRIAEPAHFSLCGIDLPMIALHAFDATTADKLGLAARTLPDMGFPGDDGIIRRP
ncbi:MAG: HPr kinase/phosphatase C-terminal domain-containing protein [Parvibaculum sp.]|nr:HPr kinase/phosphatase C-terminal domain-containing protein [Parvibaculum sp.]